MALRTAGKYLVIKRLEEEKEKRSEGGLIIHPLGNDAPHRGIVVSSVSDHISEGDIAIYQQSGVKQVDGHDIVHPDGVLCVTDAA